MRGQTNDLRKKQRKNKERTEQPNQGQTNYIRKKHRKKKNKEREKKHRNKAAERSVKCLAPTTTLTAAVKMQKTTSDALEHSTLKREKKDCEMIEKQLK